VRRSSDEHQSARQLRGGPRLRVHVAGQPFAIDVTQVREVAIFEGWTTVPLAPPHLVGVANLRGDVVPIRRWPRAVLGWHRAAARASCRP